MHAPNTYRGDYRHDTSATGGDLGSILLRPQLETVKTGEVLKARRWEGVRRWTTVLLWRFGHAAYRCRSKTRMASEAIAMRSDRLRISIHWVPLPFLNRCAAGRLLGTDKESCRVLHQVRRPKLVSFCLERLQDDPMRM